VFDESQRPVAPPAPADHVYSEYDRAAAQHLVDIHNHLRRELAQIRTLLEEVEQGHLGVGEAREALHGMSIRRHSWNLGAYCAAYCSLLTQHHSLEDAMLFPRLRAGDPGLGPVLDRLSHEHHVIHEVIERVDKTLTQPGQPGLRDAVETLAEALLSHLDYEERQLMEPIARIGLL
jgi:hemerythrin-like domain-containing protein